MAKYYKTEKEFEKAFNDLLKKKIPEKQKYDEIIKFIQQIPLDSLDKQPIDDDVSITFPFAIRDEVTLPTLEIKKDLIIHFKALDGVFRIYKYGRKNFDLNIGDLRKYQKSFLLTDADIDGNLITLIDRLWATLDPGTKTKSSITTYRPQRELLSVHPGLDYEVAKLAKQQLASDLSIAINGFHDKIIDLAAYWINTTSFFEVFKNFEEINKRLNKLETPDTDISSALLGGLVTVLVPGAVIGLIGSAAGAGLIKIAGNLSEGSIVELESIAQQAFPGGRLMAGMANGNNNTNKLSEAMISEFATNGVESYVSNAYGKLNLTRTDPGKLPNFNLIENIRDSIVTNLYAQLDAINKIQDPTVINALTNTYRHYQKFLQTNIPNVQYWLSAEYNVGSFYNIADISAPIFTKTSGSNEVIKTNNTIFQNWLAVLKNSTSLSKNEKDLEGIIDSIHSVFYEHPVYIDLSYDVPKFTVDDFISRFKNGVSMYGSPMLQHLMGSFINDLNTDDSYSLGFNILHQKNSDRFFWVVESRYKQTQEIKYWYAAHVAPSGVAIIKKIKQGSSDPIIKEFDETKEPNLMSKENFYHYLNGAAEISKADMFLENLKKIF